MDDFTTNTLVEQIRAAAIEEFRQQMKISPIDIAAFIEVEKAAEYLTRRGPDRRYGKFFNC